MFYFSRCQTKGLKASETHLMKRWNSTEDSQRENSKVDAEGLEQVIGKNKNDFFPSFNA